MWAEADLLWPEAPFRAGLLGLRGLRGPTTPPQGAVDAVTLEQDQAAAAAAHKPPLLALDGVTLEYETDDRIVRATHRVSLQVHSGERYVLLGPSGCGKSTLLKAAAGFIKPREGCIQLHGQDVLGPGPDRMVVFQEFDQLPPWKTVLGNVMFPLLATRRLPRLQAEGRALQVLEQVGLTAFAKA